LDLINENFIRNDEMKRSFLFFSLELNEKKVNEKKKYKRKTKVK
jgi:hypothetical protein